MLLLTANIPGEHDRTIMDLRVYVSAFEGRFGLEMTCDLLLDLCCCNPECRIASKPREAEDFFRCLAD